MKVPPPPPPPPGYDKDRTLTRRTVKGAAGGLEGVDYAHEAERTVDPVKGTAGAGSNREDKDRDRAKPGSTSRVIAGRKAQEANLPAGAMVRDEHELVLEDEDATTRETKHKQTVRVVFRDRMTIDKDAPQLLRKPKFESPEEESEEASEEELDLEAFGDIVLGADLSYEYSPRRRSRVGDPALTDPEAMMVALGTPNAYARHSLVLAEAYRSAGAYRHEAIEYLGSLFVALRDRGFARNALKELGIGTGVVDLYPLEVVDHLLTAYPGFLPKSGYGRLFRPGRGKTETLHLRPGVPRLLEYSADLRVRGFALVGGGRPGYSFEPGPELGKYSLRIDRPGEFQLLVSALTKSGHTIVDRLSVKVRGAMKKRFDAPTLIPRDERRLATWPRPTPRPIEPDELLEEDEPTTALSGGELARRQQLDALHGPKGDQPEELQAGAAATPSSNPDDEELSQAEASMLWLALATHSQASDLVLPKKDDSED